MVNWTAVIVIFTRILCVCYSLKTEPEVKVQQGVLRGNVARSVNGFKYFIFKGIPYAKPPVGVLKFMVILY